jgi:hypothetical protein
MLIVFTIRFIANKNIFIHSFLYIHVVMLHCPVAHCQYTLRYLLGLRRRLTTARHRRHYTCLNCNKRSGKCPAVIYFSFDDQEWRYLSKRCS